MAAVIVVILLFSCGRTDGESVCFGTTGKGRLENAMKLPARGLNFSAYSRIGVLAGRTWVHSRVYHAVVAAYEMLARSCPEKFFVYGETGWKNGGRFRPHKTHRNGLSVDFMVPVLDKNGKSVPLPATVFNKLGYALEFDANGVCGEYRIDFEAMAAHLKALHQASDTAGTGIRRVIFDPALQPFLMHTTYGVYIKKHLVFSGKRSWVRHDEHYHADFEVRLIYSNQIVNVY